VISPARILLVEDDHANALMLKEALSRWGYAVTEVESGDDAIRLGKAEPFDVVLCDIRVGRTDGLEVLRVFRRIHPDSVVIMMTGFGSVDTAVEAIKAGAFDYISKPFKFDEIKLSLARAVEQREANRRTGETPREDWHSGELELIGHSRAMAEVYKTIAMVAAGRSTVLIQGESGTGKELVAHAIHKHSNRSKMPFVAVNCAALPETLLESELFGYAQGAHSTALADKPGVFEQAAEGVLLLDEVGDMSLSLQAKLLRVLEDSETRRIGGTRSIKTDVRVIAATNRDLDTLVQENKFRADLLYRLKVVTINLPPLRDRKEDIPALTEHFIRKYSTVAHKWVTEAAAEVLESFQAYSWPGNVRELENVIERAVILNTKTKIMVEDIPEEIRCGRGSPPTLSLQETERRHIATVLRGTKGNIKAAATLLGIDRKTLYRKLADYGIDVQRE